MREHVHFFTFWDFSQAIEDAPIKIIGGDGREREIHDLVERVIEIAGKSTDDRGFAASRFSRDEADAPGSFQMLHARQPLFQGGRLK